MSRIGNKTITVPEGVTITRNENEVTVKGPKGELTRSFSPIITMTVDGNEISFARPNDLKENRAMHGTMRANLNNMIVGVTVGFEKALDLIGVGYRAQLQGNKLVMNVGYSHPIEFNVEEGLTVEVPANTRVVVKGTNKERVGELAANIRAVRPPEPYKGKGIRYVDEFVRRKEGKTGK
ncbi:MULTISPECIES: 50S ribosomal protein L6 [Carnobacterium]|uniref:Large ribosomal subunit protein uL6 n=1 Tax=Carnobacterium antarcticum TaxID=2126436 RepID=A0ABW4NL11_9LACT|nr:MULTISPECIES: 50S ribosomal protein L6 [unclassified Carnobacterium]ALV22257.1 LSU ribosomal protein L6p [Carnobacterium sp. CP1]QQP70208.1 50S ribosomal protein L6 [Carnobacterium sp. CS13]